MLTHYSEDFQQCTYFFGVIHLLENLFCLLLRPHPVTPLEGQGTCLTIKYNCDQYKHSFFAQTLPQWNSLSEASVDSAELPEFKASLHPSPGTNKNSIDYWPAGPVRLNYYWSGRCITCPKYITLLSWTYLIITESTENTLLCLNMLYHLCNNSTQAVLCNIIFGRIIYWPAWANEAKY